MDKRGRFFNIPDVYFIWPNEIDDPIARHKGKEVNGYDLESYLVDQYESTQPAEEFYDWVHNHPKIVRDYIARRGR